MKNSTQGWPLSARILRALSRSTDEQDHAGGTELNVGEHALDFVLKTVPDFLELIRGRTVLDYGCGMGEQVVAIQSAGALRAVGYDPYLKVPPATASLAEFTGQLPYEQFDVVLSSSSFEHFADPEREFVTMRDLIRQYLVITWAEPWYSHSGSHASFFTHVPWVNLLFPERSVFLVRSLFRQDAAAGYEEAGLGGALNRMTVARYERIVRSLRGSLEIEFARNYATKQLPLVTQIPVLRELLTGACTCVLKRRAAHSASNSR